MLLVAQSDVGCSTAATGLLMYVYIAAVASCDLAQWCIHVGNMPVWWKHMNWVVRSEYIPNLACLNSNWTEIRGRKRTVKCRVPVELLEQQLRSC